MHFIQKSILIIFSVLSVLTVGAAFGAAEEEILSRGWIGGEYREADPSWFMKLTHNYFEDSKGVVAAIPGVVQKRQESAILVSRVFENTPAALGGLREGDLILEVDHQKVEDLSDFREAVDALAPGATIMFTIYRDAALSDQPIKIGRETYRNQHTFSLGLSLGSEFDPVPTPDFSIFSIIYYKTRANRLELNSPEFQYFSKVRQSEMSAVEPVEADEKTKPEVEASREGWTFWFLIFGIGGDHLVVAQETVD